MGFEEGKGLAEAGGGFVVAAAFHGEAGGLIELLGGFEGVGGGRWLGAMEELFGEIEVGLEVGERALGAEDIALVVAVEGEGLVEGGGGFLVLAEGCEGDAES